MVRIIPDRTVPRGRSERSLRYSRRPRWPRQTRVSPSSISACLVGRRGRGLRRCTTRHVLADADARSPRSRSRRGTRAAANVVQHQRGADRARRERRLRRGEPDRLRSPPARRPSAQQRQATIAYDNALRADTFTGTAATDASHLLGDDAAIEALARAGGDRPEHRDDRDHRRTRSSRSSQPPASDAADVAHRHRAPRPGLTSGISFGARPPARLRARIRWTAAAMMIAARSTPRTWSSRARWYSASAPAASSSG